MAEPPPKPYGRVITLASDPTTAGPSTTGTLLVAADGCLVFGGRLAVFPPGARWEVEEGAVELADGRLIRTGTVTVAAAPTAAPTSDQMASSAQADLAVCRSAASEVVVLTP